MRKMVLTMGAVSVLTFQGCAHSTQPEYAPVVEVATVIRESTMDGSRGKTFGLVSFIDGPHGLIIKPRLRGLDPGPHAAHIHDNANCGPDEMGMPAGAAGGHLDPAGTGVHSGPYEEGHLGDLPNLIVEPDGRALLPVLAPRVKVADLKGRSLMVHAGADRYADYGEHLHGKGGMRMYCGVIR